MSGTHPADEQFRSWIITVTTSARGNLETVRTSVETCGFTVDRVLPALGQLSGRAPDAAVAEVAALQEVSSVDPDTSVNVVPPDSEVQ